MQKSLSCAEPPQWLLTLLTTGKNKILTPGQLMAIQGFYFIDADAETSTHTSQKVKSKQKHTNNSLEKSKDSSTDSSASVASSKSDQNNKNVQFVLNDQTCEKFKEMHDKEEGFPAIYKSAKLTKYDTFG